VIESRLVGVTVTSSEISRLHKIETVPHTWILFWIWVRVRPGKLLMVGVHDFADLRPKNRQIYVPFLRI